MKFRLLFLILVLFPALLVLSLYIRTNEDNKSDLTLTIYCLEYEIKQGDEIPILFTITNKGKYSHAYDKRNYDRSGRLPEYKLVAKCEDETTVLDPRERDLRSSRIYGGLSSGRGYIGQGESFSKIIALNLWALINEPGRYTVRGTYISGMYNPPMEQIRVDSKPIEITVQPRSDEEIVDYIKELSDELKKDSIPDSRKTYSGMRQAREKIIQRLIYMCEPRIVPILIELMYENHHKNDAFWAKEGFVCYLPHDLKIKKTVLSAAKRRGLARCMKTVLEVLGCSEEEFKQIIRISLSSDNPDIVSEGVGAAQTHPDDEHMPKLVAIVTDPNRPDPNRRFSSVKRHRAISAIANNRTDEGVKTLRILLESPSEGIRKTTKRAIQQAYKRHRVYPKYTDDEYTSKLITAAKDSNHPMATSFLVGTIARSLTEEGIEAIKALLENPDMDIPIAKTDEGIHTISNLLRNPDKDVRDITETIIRQIYRTYPGRPLREDDFPELLKEFVEERKANIKRFLERLRADN